MIERPYRKLTGEYLVNKNKEFEINITECYKWASYLAKVNQKNNTPDGYRKYHSSKLDRPLGKLWSGMELNGQLFYNLQARNYNTHIYQL